jgi:hypothetical protein
MRGRTSVAVRGTPHTIPVDQSILAALVDEHTEAFTFSTFRWRFLMDDDSKDDQSERIYAKLTDEEKDSVLKEFKRIREDEKLYMAKPITPSIQ